MKLKLIVALTVGVFSVNVRADHHGADRAKEKTQEVVEVLGVNNILV